MRVVLDVLTERPHRLGEPVLVVESDEWTITVTCNGQGTYWVNQVDVLNEENWRSQTVRSVIEARDVARTWAQQGIREVAGGMHA
ncbi:MAG TPA: hypothetical protein VGG64_19215 [Pirellulales bacterium]|jgi:hypothetical protein